MVSAVGTLAARSTVEGCVWRNVKPPLMVEKPVTETRPHSLAAVRVHLGERSFKWKVENAHPRPLFTGDTMDTQDSLTDLPGFLVYLDRCSPDERSQLCYIIEKIGKRQYFSALRGLAALVKICTDNLQDAIQETL